MKGENMSRKFFIVACNAGVATSQAVASKIKRLLEEKGFNNFDIEAVDVSTLEHHIKRADAYIAIVPNKSDYNIPKLDGVAFLTGNNMNEELDKLIEILKD